MKTALGIALMLLSGLLVACGGEGSSFDAPDLAGVYVLDVDRTLGEPATGVVAAEARARLETAFHPDAWILDLKPGGAFSLRMDHGGDVFVLDGTWQRTTSGVTLRATEANGAAIPAEEQQDDLVAFDGEVLRLTQGDRDMILRRQ